MLFGPPDVRKMKEKKDVKGLINALGYQKESIVRCESAAALGEIGGFGAVEALICVLKDENAQVRGTSAQALGIIGEPAAVDALIAALKDENALVRGNSACALGRIGDNRAMDALINCLNDSVKWVRMDSALALGKLGDQRALPALFPLLRELEINKVAADALDELGWQPDSGEDGAWYWFTRQEWIKCLELGKVAAGPLIATFRDQKTHSSVTDNLAEIGTPAVAALLAIVVDGGCDFRGVVAEALGKIGDVSVVNVLIPLLKDEDEKVRVKAKEALARLSEDKRSEKPKESTLEHYSLIKTSLGNHMHLEVSTERYCVYCEKLRDPYLLNPDYPKGVGECYYGVHSFDDTCKHWKPNTKVRFWLSKGYMQNNQEGWPRRPWYRLFDDGPDGEKGTH